MFYPLSLSMYSCCINTYKLNLPRKLIIRTMDHHCCQVMTCLSDTLSDSRVVKYVNEP